MVVTKIDQVLKDFHELLVQIFLKLKRLIRCSFLVGR